MFTSYLKTCSIVIGLFSQTERGADMDIAERRKVLGAKLRETRQERRLSQAEFAAKAGISPVYFSQIEAGQRIPVDAVCTRISEVLPDAMDWHTFRVEAMQLREPTTAALFKRQDRVSELDRDPHFYQLRVALDNLPPELRTHFLVSWTRELQMLGERTARAEEIIHRMKKS